MIVLAIFTFFAVVEAPILWATQVHPFKVVEKVACPEHTPKDVQCIKALTQSPVQ